jgi:hypothetical protein
MYPEPKEYGSWHELTQCKSVLSRMDTFMMIILTVLLDDIFKMLH